MSQSIIAPQPKSKQNFPSIETNCKAGETKLLTAVPAEGYLALRQHRIILCAAPIFFQGCVSPALICGWGLFVYRLQRVPLSERVRGRLCSAFCCRQRQTKKHPQPRLWASVSKNLSLRGRCPKGAEGENLAIARNISDSCTVFSPTACGRSPLAEGAKG